MNVGENIRKRRQAKGWKILELANRVDSDVGNISRLERGKQGYSDEILSKIAKAMECSVADLFVDVDTAVDMPEGAKMVSAARMVWVIGNGQGGLPDRIWTDGDYPVGASDKFAEVATDDVHAFAVTVRGDSMVPRYQPGEYALVKPGTAPEIEDDVLVRLSSGETMIKRLLSRRGGIRLGSYNSTEVMTFAEDEITWMYYVSHPIPAREIKHWVDDTQQKTTHRTVRVSERRKANLPFSFPDRRAKHGS